MAHRTLASEAELWALAAMGDLLPAPRPASPLMLECQWGTLEILTLVFPWGTLVCVAGLVFLLHRRYTSQSGEMPGEACSSHVEDSVQQTESAGPTTQGEGAGRPPGGEASPPLLQTLCLASLNTSVSRQFSKGTGDLAEKTRRSPPPQLPPREP